MDASVESIENHGCGCIGETNYYEDAYSVFSHASRETGFDLDDQKFILTFKTFLIFVNGTIASLLFGYDTAIVCGLFFLAPHDLNREVLTNWNKECIAGVTCVGCFFGASINISDRYGRKFVLQLSMMGFIISSFVMTFSYSLGMLILGRFMIGLSIGLASTTCPLYLSEIAPTSIRNYIMTLNTIAITGGQVLAYLISLSIDTKRPKLHSELTHGFVISWRMVLFLPVFPALFMLCALPFVPESPRYLISKAKFKEAQKSLFMIYPYATKLQIDQKIYKTAKDITRVVSVNIQTDPVVLNNETNESSPLLTEQSPVATGNGSDNNHSLFSSTKPVDINLHRLLQDLHLTNINHRDECRKSTHLAAKQSQDNFLTRWFQNFVSMDPRTKRALWVGCTLMFFQQITGFNSFMNYSPLIFKPYTNNPLIPGFLVSLVNFLGTIMSLNYINKFGSRKLLLYSIPWMFIGLALCFVAFREHVPQDGSSTHMLVISMLVFVLSYAFAMGNVPNMSVAFLPLNKRGFGQSCILMVNWSTNFLITISYLTFSEWLGNASVMGFYAIMTVLAWIFVYKYFPEVKGLSLEEIGLIFSNGINVNYVYENYHS